MARTTQRRIKELMNELYEAAGGKHAGIKALDECRVALSGVCIGPYKDGAWAASWFTGTGTNVRWVERWLSAREIADGSVVARIKAMLPPDHDSFGIPESTLDNLEIT
jgi:hypothetical protein